MAIPPKPDPEKYCETCGVRMARKRFNGRLEDRGVFLRRKYCDLSCANTRAELTSKDGHHWRARQYRKPACESCGTPDRLHVHHKDRDHTNNHPSNLATLCGSCHLRLHWREDRAKRLVAAKVAAETARSRGAHTRPRSVDGRWRSVDPLPLLPS